MLGWHVSVYRQENGGSSLATKESPITGPRIAVWQTDPYGLKWLDELTKEGHAIHYPGGGYPDRYTARAKEIVPRLLEGPPEARETWHRDTGDVITEQWVGKTMINRVEVDACTSDEWLMIEAWDES
jgi:hypothetical protein